MKPTRNEMNLLVMMAHRVRQAKREYRHYAQLCQDDDDREDYRSPKAREHNTLRNQARAVELELHNVLVTAKAIIYQGQSVSVFRTAQSAAACLRAKGTPYE